MPTGSHPFDCATAVQSKSIDENNICAARRQKAVIFCFLVGFRTDANRDVFAALKRGLVKLQGDEEVVKVIVIAKELIHDVQLCDGAGSGLGDLFRSKPAKVVVAVGIGGIE